MKKIAFFLLALLLACGAHAQHKQKSAQAKQPQKTIIKKANPTQKQAVPSKKAKATKKKAPVYTNASIRGLQGQRSQIQKKIKEQEQALKKNQADVKQRLNTLITLNTQIDERQKNIDGIQKDINNINGNIDILNAQLKTLEQQLADRKEKYIQSMRYLAKHRNVQDKLLFIFSAESFTQMYRRLRFVREYADFQKAQGEMVMAKQAQVDGKQTQLKQVKGEKNNLLYKGKKEKEALEGQQEEQKKVVASLQNQQKTIQKVIAEQRQKDAALNAQIDKLVAIEVAKARARAAEEARRKAAAKAEAQRKAAEIEELKKLHKTLQPLYAAFEAKKQWPTGSLQFTEKKLKVNKNICYQLQLKDSNTYVWVRIEKDALVEVELPKRLRNKLMNTDKADTKHAANSSKKASTGTSGQAKDDEKKKTNKTENKAEGGETSTETPGASLGEATVTPKP